MPMLYLNVRHTLPMIGIQSQKNTLDSGIQQPQYDQETQDARSNLYATQPKLDIDSYPSRHSYGHSSNADFAADNMQRGFSGVQEGTSKHTQMGWSRAVDGPKPGRRVAGGRGCRRADRRAHDAALECHKPCTCRVQPRQYRDLSAAEGQHPRVGQRRKI